MFLQSLAMALIESLDIKLNVFKQNHPGGDIGRKLSTNTNNQIVYIKTATDLIGNPIIDNLLYTAKVLSFDLDGTLIGKKNPLIPVDTFGKLSDKYTTMLITGASLTSISRKIRAHYNNEQTIIKFNGPIITNEGAQIYKTLSELKSLIYQSKIPKQAIPFLSDLVMSNKLEASFYGFYSTDNTYNFLLTDKTLQKNLAKKYDLINFITKPSDFINLMEQQDLIKFTVKVKQRSQQYVYNKYLNLVYNEGYLNYTSRNSSKIAGLQHAKKILNLKITKENLIHFGNDVNDYDLLEFSATGVIVNSNPTATKLLVSRLKKAKVNHCLVIPPKLLPLFLTKLAGN